MIYTSACHELLPHSTHTLTTEAGSNNAKNEAIVTVLQLLQTLAQLHDRVQAAMHSAGSTVADASAAIANNSDAAGRSIGQSSRWWHFTDAGAAGSSTTIHSNSTGTASPAPDTTLVKQQTQQVSDSKWMAIPMLLSYVCTRLEQHQTTGKPMTIGDCAVLLEGPLAHVLVLLLDGSRSVADVSSNIGTYQALLRLIR